MKHFLPIFLIGLFAFPLSALAIDTKAEQAYIVDFETGQPLLSKNADTRMPTSSMSKVMTSYMVFDALKNEELSMDDEFYVSEEAWKKGGSKMFVPVGEKVSIEDLLRGVIVQSGNDATIVLAEGISGTEEAFARKMTAKAQELGMSNSNFMNASGWPDDNHYSTAKDLATLASATIRNFPDYYPMFAETEFTYNDIRQENRNPLLGRGLGADGIKTGHTEDAGYGLIASAQQDGRRVIMVLNGMDSAKERVEESIRLIRWALLNFVNVDIASKGKMVTEAPVVFGKQESVPLTVAEDIKLTLPDTARTTYEVTAVFDAPLRAPIEAGQEVGTLNITIPNLPPMSVPLQAAQSVEEDSFFGQFKTKLKYILLGDV
jgi:D-alanyl-D-alanine carboxypeptidase (penicillin-binding protein 5/6)